MSKASPSEIINQICHEAEQFDTKDRLLNFSTKGDFQTPLVLEAGDLFFEKWNQSAGPLSLDSFIPTSATFTEEQKNDLKEQFYSVFREKSEDFINSDLYLTLGFLKWDGNALAPTLLVPVNVNPETKLLTLSKRNPIENVILRERLKDTIQLPKAEEAILNGQFSILLYFSLFEKAVLPEKKWKFTRHGLSLAFFNTDRLQLKKRLDRGFDDRKLNNKPFIRSLLSPEGFQFKESVFEDSDINKIFNPADHHFLYPSDSHTTKVTIDALTDDTDYAIQTLPGTAKMQVAANIVAESIATGKRTLVVARRAISKQTFFSTLQPPFRSFNGPERKELEENIRKNREAFEAYYNIVNNNIVSTEAPLSDILTEFLQNPATKAKIPEDTFKGVSNLTFSKYLTAKKCVEKIVSLYFEKNGIEAQKAFEKTKISNIDDEKKKSIAEELKFATTKVDGLKPIIDAVQEMGIFPSGIYLSALADIIELIQKNFNEKTPVFERWELRSNSWSAYQDSLKALPEAGDKWVRYRRQTSDIYTDSAVDENIASTRDEFADSLKATLKGLSDHYRNSRKRLMSVLKKPKNVQSDAQLLDLIDTLIELQENKRAYKDTAVLGNHLLGKDWLFEKSNWVELNKKIQFIYDFRETHKKDSNLDMLLQILENWHTLKSLQPKMNEFVECVRTLQQSVRNITNNLALDAPLESLSIDKWLNEIQQWNENWIHLDVHLELRTQFKTLEELGCSDLAAYASNAYSVHRDLAKAFSHYWAGSQVQQVANSCPDLFTLSPKGRSQKGKDYRSQLDQFSNANFREVLTTLETNKDIFKFASLSETMEFDKSEHFDIAILLDADCTSVAESFSIIYAADKLILIGDPHTPQIEAQVTDGFANIQSRQNQFFQDNILAAALRKGIPTRELWLSNIYNDISLVDFANARIYNHGIKQFPQTAREKNKNETIKIVPDKIVAIAKAAILHAERHANLTLGIIVFNQARRAEIEAAIKTLVDKNSSAYKFFNQKNSLIRFYIKTPDRAVDKYRDNILVCADPDGTDKPSTEHKLAICTTLAMRELHVFISEADINKQKTAKTNIFWDWINYLQKKITLSAKNPIPKESILQSQIVEVIQSENIKVENHFTPGGISVGPVVIDANNPNRCLAVVEDDCTTDKFRESIEDRIYIRPKILRQLGWKVLNIWLPFWYMSNADEKSHLITSIAIEQSVAPPPPDESASASEDSDSFIENSALNIEPYQIRHPKIEGTPHDKPIAELPAASLITQLKFYVDYEAPIHEEILLQRILEIHHVDRAGPMIMQALNDAIKLGIQKQRFIKTGKFFYSTKNPPVILRDRSSLPENERKLSYVSPEERALVPSSMDDRTIKQTLGLLE